jgi:murein L,D-transpeptidase YafK
MRADLKREAGALAAILLLGLGYPAALHTQQPLGVEAPEFYWGGLETLTSSFRAGPAGSTLLSRQLVFPRVRQAHDTRAVVVRRLFEEQGIGDLAEVFFRVFKREQLLELWARDRAGEDLILVNTYPVCGTSGDLGPKRQQGDEQIPEGFYTIDLLNPWSRFHLSMRVDYPNAVDRARGNGNGNLGGDIFIHGGCATIGCVPVTDQWIEDLYLIAIKARDAGQSDVPVHIFPTRLDDEGMRWLADVYGAHSPHYPFWENLQEGYLYFEERGRVPSFMESRGRYAILVGGPADPIGQPVEIAEGDEAESAPAPAARGDGLLGQPVVPAEAGGEPGDTPAVQPPALAPPTVDPPVVKPPPVDPPTVDPPTVDPPTVPPAVDAPAVDPVAVDTPAVDPVAVDTPAVDPVAVDTPAVDPAA